MTKVYLVMHWCESDGDTILKLYSSEAAAQKYAAKIQKNCDPNYEDCWVAARVVCEEEE